jgi:hypothetical protein
MAPVSRDAKLSSFATAVYALPGSQHLQGFASIALRPIVAESQWTQA